MDLTSAIWRKSSRSGNGGNTCVELAALDGATAVRDSKNPGGAHLHLDSAAFAAFIAKAKNGRYDL